MKREAAFPIQIVDSDVLVMPCGCHIMVSVLSWKCLHTVYWILEFNDEVRVEQE